jgi:primosomal protein N' (replication factor Y)
MLEQVSGRAGRREWQKGMVVVQTAQPGHPVVSFLMAHDYKGFYAHEIAEREQFLYPPFTRMIYIYLKHRDARAVDDIAVNHAAILRRLLGNRVFGPEEPAIGRVQSLYIRKIMIKLELSASPSRVKASLRDAQEELYANPASKGVIIYYDVDPQ